MSNDDDETTAWHSAIVDELTRLERALDDAAAVVVVACGAKVQCAYGKCLEAFHVTCALADPALSSTLEGGTEDLRRGAVLAAHAHHVDGGSGPSKPHF